VLFDVEEAQVWHVVEAGWGAQTEAILRVVWALKTQPQYAAMEAGSRAREVWNTAIRVGVDPHKAGRLAGLDQHALLQLMQGAFSSGAAAGVSRCGAGASWFQICLAIERPAAQELCARQAALQRLCTRISHACTLAW
jgi:hypothetical protein